MKDAPEHAGPDACSNDPAAPEGHRTGEAPTVQRAALVIEPAPDLSILLARATAGAGWNVRHARASSIDALPAGLHLVIVSASDGDAPAAVRAVRDRDRGVPIAVVGAVDSARAAVEALRAGASDYLVRGPDTLAEVLALADRPPADCPSSELREAQAEAALRQWIAAGGRCDDTIWAVIGSGPQSGDLLRRIQRASESDATVLITGETGTGKEIVAQTIHRLSVRAHRPFVAQNCAALPEQLLESELFGYRKGSFTGALKDHRGLVEAGAGGTLFLDEIAEAPLIVQAKLLRFIDTKVIRPLGEVTPRRVDVRIIAATNRDLRAEVARGTFRADLFYRLNVINIRLLPLRERAGDIQPLVQCLLRCSMPGLRGQMSLDDDALAALLVYGWPGNLREFHNAIEQAIAMGDKSRIRLRDLPETLRASVGRDPRDAPPARPASAAVASGDAPPVTPPRLRNGEIRREWIESALTRAGGNRSKAARLAGLSRSSFYYNLRKHNLG
jgi:two-component system NtrC family response regulator